MTKVWSFMRFRIRWLTNQMGMAQTCRINPNFRGKKQWWSVTNKPSYVCFVFSGALELRNPLRSWVSKKSWVNFGCNALCASGTTWKFTSKQLPCTGSWSLVDRRVFQIHGTTISEAMEVNGSPKNSGGWYTTVMLKKKKKTKKTEKNKQLNW